MVKKFLRQFHYGEKGFTLIELLIVIAILGILAAVIVPNVGKFMGAGQVEAANTEYSQVSLAITAYMADNGLAALTGGEVKPNSVNTEGDLIEAYLLHPATLQGSYLYITTGAITAAGDYNGAANPALVGKWKGLWWSVAKGWYKP